jgi:hypothetical protein
MKKQIKHAHNHNHVANRASSSRLPVLPTNHNQSASNQSEQMVYNHRHRSISDDDKTKESISILDEAMQLKTN